MLNLITAYLNINVFIENAQAAKIKTRLCALRSALSLIFIIDRGRSHGGLSKPAAALSFYSPAGRDSGLDPILIASRRNASRTARKAHGARFSPGVQSRQRRI